MSHSVAGRGRSAATLLLGLAMVLTSCTDKKTEGDGTPTVASSAGAAVTSGPQTSAAASPTSAGTSAAASSAASSATTSAAPAAEPTGSFSIGVNSFFVSHLMPGNSGGSNINNALFTSLTEVGPGGEIVNAVAKSVESSDQKVWTITLNDGWTFHNGEPVTAQSFADSWNASATPKNAMFALNEFAIVKGHAEMNPAKGASATATELSGVEVVDPLTLKVTLNEPNTRFPSIIASTAFAPIPKDASKDFAKFDLNPVGNGPFMITGGGVKPGSQQVVLKAYPGYAGQKARAAELVIKVYQDSTAIYTDFRSGGIDLALVDGADLTAAKASYPGQVVDVSYPAVVWMGFPTWDKRFENVKLRQAFSMAIDRQSIVDALLKGNAKVATGVAPETLPGGGQSDCTACAYDASAAKALLAEAGGFSDTLTLYSYADPTNTAVLDAMANQLRTNLGIKASAKTLPIDQLYKSFGDESLKGAFMLYSGTNVPHMYGLASALFTKDSILNATHYSSTEVSGLLKQALAAPSADEFTSLVQQASAKALADVVVAPLYYPVGGLLHSKKLSAVEPELLGGADLSKIVVG